MHNHSNITKGTPKVSKAELSFLYATRRLVLFCISTKDHQHILKGILVTTRTQNLFQTKQREITSEVRKSELSFLNATQCLVLFYIFTTYHKNTPKGIPFTERTRNQCKITVKYNKGRYRQKQESQSCHSCTRHVVLVCSTFLPSTIIIF